MQKEIQALRKEKENLIEENKKLQVEVIEIIRGKKEPTQEAEEVKDD